MLSDFSVLFVNHRHRNKRKASSTGGACVCVTPEIPRDTQFLHAYCRGQELSLGVSCQRRRPQGGVKTYLHEAGSCTRVQLAASESVKQHFLLSG